jgi:transposase
LADVIPLLERTEHSAPELRRLACRAASPGQARRVLAIALVMEGADRTTAARSCGMDRQTLRDWVHRYNAEGVAGLVDRRRPGRPPRLSEAELAELVAIVEAGPDVETDGVVRWRCADLAGVVADRFGVTLSERSVGRLLNDRGYVRLKPRPQHPKADPEAQAAFKKTSLAR